MVLQCPTPRKELDFLKTPTKSEMSTATNTSAPKSYRIKVRKIVLPQSWRQRKQRELKSNLAMSSLRQYETNEINSNKGFVSKF